MKKTIQNRFVDEDYMEILLKGLSFLLIRVGGLLAGYFFIFFIAREYGAGTTGLVSLGFTLFLFISTFGRFGVDIHLVKFYSTSENLKENPGLFFRMILKSFLFSSFLAMVLYYYRDFVATTIFSKPQLEEYIIWIAMAIPFWTTTLICAGLFRALKKIKWYSFLNNPGRFLFSLLALFILWYFTDNPLTAIQAHFYGVLFIAILSLSKAIKELKGISFKNAYNSWIFTKDSIPLMLSTSMLIFLGWLDTFTLGIYETDSVVGIYNVSLKVATLPSFSLQAINSILAPKVAQSFREQNIVHLQRLVRFSANTNFYITLIAVIFVVIFNKWILGFFGEEFIQGSYVLIMLCVGQLINSISGPVGVILQMTGHQKVFQNIMFVALIINLILNFTLIPVYGMMGAVIATILSISSWNVIGAIYIKRKLKIHSFYSFRKV